MTFTGKHVTRMFKTLSYRTVLSHIFFISSFLIVSTLANVRPPDESVFMVNRAFIQDILANCLLLCFFYLNYYLLIPRLFFSRKYFRYILYVALFLTIACTLPHLIGKEVTGLPPDPRSFMPERPDATFRRTPDDQPLLYFILLDFRRHLYLFFTAVFFSFLLRTRERLSQLKEEKLQAALSSLKTQINPHFLFNTLNSIYVLSVKKDDKASEAIIHLSGLMRYVIRDAGNDRIPLEKEIDYVRSYIELQKARLGKTAYVHFECSGGYGNKEISPLILITYIENVFRYGINPDIDNCIVEVTLQVTDTGIRLHTFNKKVQGIAQADSTGIGMKNTGERLQHLYPQKHLLQITETKETYSVTLSIELT